MVFDSWDQIGRVLLTGAVIYVFIYAFLVLSLRLSGKRALAPSSTP
jgi:hypothetical protein